MEREHISDKVPDKLVEQVHVRGDAHRFRRRAVLVKGNDRWELICCTVEGFLPADDAPNPVLPRRYGQVILYEDFLTGEGCLQFGRELHEGRARFGDIDLQRSQLPQWTTERVPVSNDYMVHAGYVISVNFTQSGGRASIGPLLSADQPYYPNDQEAARDWLPFPVYHDCDGRNDRVLFLLPETRAFIAGASFSKHGTLDIDVAGTEAASLSLLVKGAYWEGTSLHHVESSVKNLKATLDLPSDAERFEYYLIDREGKTYDFHRKDRFSYRDQDHRTRGGLTRKLEDQVRKACHSGEGRHIEFKPFVDPSGETSIHVKGKTKLREVIETVAAFTNTDGGHIYLGVNDDCSLSGVGTALGKWIKGEPDEAAINRYFGVLKSKIKELVRGEVTLHSSHVEIDGMLVMIVEVLLGPHGPVAVQQEYHLYVRSGASNRRAVPEEWQTILKPNSPQGLVGLPYGG